MKKEIIYFDLPQLILLFKTELPDIVFLACTNDDPGEFCKQLGAYISGVLAKPSSSGQYDAARRIFKMLKHEGHTLHDLSTGNEVECNTFFTLWALLREEKTSHVHPDFMIDLYFLFKQLHGEKAERFDKKDLFAQMNRWPTGLDDRIVTVRKANKERIIKLLIEKIETRKTPHQTYRFDRSASTGEKYKLMETWWNSSHFHLQMAIRDPKELNHFLGNTLPAETVRILDKAKKKKMPFFITPYYLSLLSTGNDEYDDSTIRSYVIYSPELVENYGNIRAWEKEDRVEAGKPNAAGWLLPEGCNIHRRYPEVAILIPDSMGRACGGLCAPCQRMYDFQKKRLNFNFEELKPKETWDAKLTRLMRYYEEDSQLRDILITGGDALMSQNSTLKKILNAVYKMAQRKKEANKWRPEEKKYAEIERVRLGSRLLAYLPLRIDDELVGILRDFKEKAATVGIRQFVVQTHFESPLEMTPEALGAIQKILSSGWVITNQLVFTVAASRRGHTARLRETLNRAGILGYYTFTVKGFAENYALFAPNNRSMQEKEEEKCFGRLNAKQESQLIAAMKDTSALPSFFQRFMEKNRLPFVATDRNVLNLPGIGKSMSFKTVGITADGKRILKFRHDAGRNHSPIIHQIEEVYIVENKAVAAYLRQLEKIGEDLRLYSSIWDYAEGTTEPLFKIYRYPETGNTITPQYTNLHLDNFPEGMAM